MTRLIFNSFLLLFLLLGTVAATGKHLEVEMGNKDYKTSNVLNAVSRQKSNDNPTDGYHKAEFQLKTDMPSFNPDQSGVKKVVCKEDADGKREITFSLKDKKAAEDVKKWPKEVMLLISHKWKCFGKRSTQFFTASDAVIDESNLTTTFAIKRCDYPYHSNDFSLDVNWVENNNTRRKSKSNKRFGIPFPTIDISNKINLNALFNSDTGESSRPNIPILEGDIRLFCANCFTQGEATIGLRVKGKVFPPKINDASISLDGNFLLNLDFALEGSKGKDLPSKKGRRDDLVLLSIGLGPFNIPGLLNLGPSIDLVAAADATIAAGTIGFGGDLSLPNFHVLASFKGSPSFEQSGFIPKINAHKPTADVAVTATVSASLKPQLGFGIDILGGKVFRQKVGFEIVGTLESSFTFGACENKADPRLDSFLGSNVGFFVNSGDFPIVGLPRLNLLNKCL